MDSGILVLLATVAAFALCGYVAYKEWKRDKPDFVYKGVRIWYKSVSKDPMRDKRIKEMLYNMVIQGRKYSKEEADSIYAMVYKKPERTDEIDAAVKRGIDCIGERGIYDVKGKKIRLYIQPYPISHKNPGSKDGILLSHGVAYLDQKKAYVTIMPESRGGAQTIASLVVHEIGGHFGKHEQDSAGAGDYYHEDKEFWALVDKKVDL